MKATVVKSTASLTGLGVAALSALMSIVFALFVPNAYPWPSIAWATLACTLVVFVGLNSARATAWIGSPRVAAEPNRDSRASHVGRSGTQS
jgi:hypothetical protein